MAGLQLEADELLNEAIMSETPVLIVEGIDDIGVYENISMSIGKTCEVYAAENISGISEGCRGVITCIDNIRQASNDFDITPYILGIVDRDTRPYRNETPEDDAILLLNWYSMESHFLTNNATEFVIRNLTKVTNSLLSDDLIQQVHATVKSQLDWLYYISLEALKGSCHESYQSCVGYSMGIGEIKGRNLSAEVIQKQAELDAFATQKGITNCWDELLKICKGKWIFTEYCYQLKSQINLLKNKCETSEIEQCQFCLSETFDKCLYKLKNTYNENHIQDMIMNHIHTGSFNYVKARLSQMI
ncbi:hypothetical protein NW014_004117 [Vibrio parahaemolyticus]|nr:hypothetical protein [Vibrio parahaemolyticus]ELC3160019.1 hypothetical protein [Vibrio harveyi]